MPVCEDSLPVRDRSWFSSLRQLGCLCRGEGVSRVILGGLKMSGGFRAPEKCHRHCCQEEGSRGKRRMRQDGRCAPQTVPKGPQHHQDISQWGV